MGHPPEDAIRQARRRFAEELRRSAGIRSEAVVRAFATVPRERYLGPGPWRLLVVAGGRVRYRTTPDDDPRHLYRNALVGLDESRHLNNGEPAGLARWFDTLELRRGERVVHVGCGVGYYSAILAELVGPEGRVAALEVDPELAARAARNLSDHSQVEVVCGDGCKHDIGPADAIFVNAGATHPVPAWLDALANGGRLLLPLTVSFPSGETDQGPAFEPRPQPVFTAGGGHMLLVRRSGTGFEARFVCPVGIFPCLGARDPRAEQRLRAAYSAGRHDDVHALRRDPHVRDDACWLHGGDFCLRREAP